MIPVPFEVETKELDGVLLFAIRGELDMNTAPELEEPLGRAVSSQVSILIDLSECEFIDSTGVALIVRAWQQVDGGESSGKARLALCCPNNQVRRLLDITGVESSISLYDDLDSALAALRS